MNRESKALCAKEFLQDAIDSYPEDPSQVLLDVRRFTNQRDTAEFTTQQRIVTQCQLGGCTVSLVMNEGKIAVDAPGCPRTRKS